MLVQFAECGVLTEKCATRTDCSAQALGEQRMMISHMENLSVKGEQQKKLAHVIKCLVDNLDLWEFFYQHWRIRGVQLCS